MKKIRIFIIILLIINIVVTILLLSINNDGDNNNEYEETQRYYSERVIPRNSYELLLNYKGDVDKDEIYKKLNLFIKYIPELYKDVNNFSEGDLKSYYKEQKNIIVENTGIDDSDEFVELVNCIILNDIVQSEFSYASIIKNTVANKEDKTSFQVDLVYKDEKTMKVEIQVNNSSSSKNNIKINPKR